MARPTRLRALLVVLATIAVTAAPGILRPAVAAASPSITLVGHGWGHGRGMGQWGAYGYAIDHGWRHTQILDHFYGGTAMGSIGDPLIRVDLTAWIGVAPIVTSAPGFRIGSFGAVGPGTAAEVFKDVDGRWKMRTWAGGCTRTAGPYGPYDIGDPYITPLAPPGDDINAMLTTCGSERRTYRGALGIAEYLGTTHLTNELAVNEYLRGVVPRESPASWGSDGGIDPGTGMARGMQALLAQAVAARSYAWAEDRPGSWRTCDTTACQVYGGAALNGVGLEDARTDSAVALTLGQVRVRSGVVARTEFSASTGGWSAGGDVPPVEDLGDVRSPYHNWTVTLSGSAIEAAYPSIGTFTGLQVTQRNGLGADGGRVLALVVWGTAGQKSDTGDGFRIKLGLRSDWFAPPGSTQLLWYARNAPSAGAPDATAAFGGPAVRPLGCDFDGDGDDGATVYDGDTFYARHSVSGGPPEVTARYGAVGYLPLCGDWDGVGGDGIGVYVGDTWYLRNSPTPGPPDYVVRFGYPGVIPVVADWDGDGRDGIGVYDRGTWYLRETPSEGDPEYSFQYGIAGYSPVTGDWDGDSTEGIGVFVGGTWHLRQRPSPGPGELSFAYGVAGYTPVVGDWDGAGPAGVGVTVPG